MQRQMLQRQMLQNIKNVLISLYSIVFIHKNSSNEPENSSITLQLNYFYVILNSKPQRSAP